MRECAVDGVFADRVGEDFGDGPVRGCGGHNEDKGADFGGSEDAFCLACVAVVIRLVAEILRGLCYLLFGQGSIAVDLQCFCLEVSIRVDGCAVAFYDCFEDVVDHGMQVLPVRFEPAFREASKAFGDEGTVVEEGAGLFEW
jgi:hypothetical protein